ncbi:MAG: SDR family NAD(P)-dependent oxidoreductase [Caldilinea sp. CFX5]|nr:SDR family NAD(P)-dependent oxidoreductase [Caldilinea sp. CFX5]
MSDNGVEQPVGDIAVIGLSGRFPGAPDLDTFWDNLCHGVESIQRFNAANLSASGLDPALLTMPGYVPARGTMGDTDQFDAAFFGFTPRDAEILDPQQRLFLECAWQALENAGYNPDTYEQLIGVFGGCGISTYLFQLFRNPELMALVGMDQINLSNDKDHLTTRTAYKLNLRGPAVTIQTACSTSLVAVTMACQSLLTYQCDIALAGGVKVEVPEHTGYFYQEGGILSPDGHCRAFDADAKGTVGGNGVGIVVLKRLAEALADGDTIHAVIIGSALNNDGAVKVGYTAPSVDGQTQAILTALAIAGVEAETIDYIETHGTGTVLGDPIEIMALRQAFGAGANGHRVAIGSVKTNIGHLDSASGIAGLIKTVLALRNRKIPPSLHFQRPNAKIDFVNSPFYVNTQLRNWETPGRTRRAGVSSFGIGGTNAHVILEEGPVRAGTPSRRAQHLLTLSARTSSALDNLTTNLAHHLGIHPALEPADVAYTLQVGRRAHTHRRVVVCTDRQDAITALQGREPARSFAGQATDNRQVVFLFSGQGTQYVAMAAEHYQTEELFRQEVDRCADLLQPHLGIDLRTLLYPTHDQLDTAAARLQQTEIAQPALFVIEYALAQLWMSWGVTPVALLGHSIGEYVAACLAGVLTLNDALMVVAARGRLMQQMPPGAMVAVALSADAVQPLLGASLDLAAVNGPQQCVVSGPIDAISELEAQLIAQAVACRRLHTSHAFHSRLMEAMLDPFGAVLRAVTWRAPTIPFISNVTGAWISDADATNPAYWTKQLRQTVRWLDGLTQLLQQPTWLPLEVGPGHTLADLVRQHPDFTAQQLALHSLRAAQEATTDETIWLTTAGRLWTAGVPVAWSAIYAGEQRCRVPLPTYPFERQRYWVEAATPSVGATREQTSPLGRLPLADWFYVPMWQQLPLPVVPPAPPTTWLVFADEQGVAGQLTERLRADGHLVTTVTLGDAFVHASDLSRVTMRAAHKADYSALLELLTTANQLPAYILHLWGVSGAANTENDGAPDTLGASLDRGFFSLTYLAQALGTVTVGQAVEILVVSDHVHKVAGNEQLQPHKATMLGLCRVITQEYPHVRCRHVDVVATIPSRVAGVLPALADQILAEAFSRAADGDVAYRGHERWIRHFERAIFDEPAGLPSLLRTEGVYLITGGLGGIGLELARYLAQATQARLALLGRTALPPRDQWPEWIANHEAEDNISQKIRAVQALEAMGAAVLTVAADVVDHDQMRGALDSIEAHFGTLHGVIHAAGVPGGGVLQLATPTTANRVLRPKIQGTLTLDAVLGERQLDFIILCSSLASLLGGAGQSDYCAANAFLDAYAQASARPMIAVNWDRWQGTGMAAGIETTLDSGWSGITREEGVAAFRRILQPLWRQVAVSSVDFRPLLHVPAVNPSVHRTPSRTQTTATHQRPALATAFALASSTTEQAVVELFEGMLGVAPVGVNDSFFELGGHSLLAIQVLSRLNERLHVQLPIQSIFEAPTASTLAQLIQTVQLATHPGTPQRTDEDEEYEEGEI